MDKHSITWIVGNGHLYSVRPDVIKGERENGELVQWVSEFKESIRKTVAVERIRKFSVELWSGNQGTTEAEEVNES
jgi:hypothetical protein